MKHKMVPLTFLFDQKELIESNIKKKLIASLLGRCVANDEDAHEENHDEEDPHEKSVHHLSDLLPFCPFSACGPLLSETVGDIFNIAHQLGVHTRNATTMATEHAGAKGNSGALRWRLFVFRAAGDLLVLSTAVTCRNFPVRAFIFPRSKAAEVAPLFSSDVMLGFHSGMVLRLGGLRSGVLVTLPVLSAIVAPWFTIRVNVGTEVLVTDVVLGVGR